MSDRGSLLDRLTGGEVGPDEDPRLAQFVRGVAIGALVGAAIAGSTLLQRRRSAEKAAAASREPGSEPIVTPGSPAPEAASPDEADRLERNGRL